MRKIMTKQTRALCTREWKSAAHSPQGKKENTEKRNENARWRRGGGGRARRIKSYCVEHTSAEMATVLRNQTPILIRLREKLELQLCTVFHSTRNSIILTRNAY